MPSIIIRTHHGRDLYDSAMPDPEPDGWEWTLVDIVCPTCGNVNQLHEQRPEWLVEGVVWECRHCGAKHQLGGRVDTGVADVLVECPVCHNTYLIQPGTSLTHEHTDGPVVMHATADNADGVTGVAQ